MASNRSRTWNYFCGNNSEHIGCYAGTAGLQPYVGERTRANVGGSARTAPSRRLEFAIYRFSITRLCTARPK